MVGPQIAWVIIQDWEASTTKLTSSGLCNCKSYSSDIDLVLSLENHFYNKHMNS